MKCARAESKMADRVAGHLEPELAAELDAHVARCASCREFERGVALLYALDAPRAACPPVRPPATPVGPPARGTPGAGAAPRLGARRRAAAALLAVAAGLSVLAVLRGGGGERRDATRGAPLAAAVVSLAPVPVALPDLPPRYPDEGWLTSAREAEILSAYTGKPVLEQFVNPICPRCRAVNGLLAEPDMQGFLDGFVTLRRFVVDVAPEELATLEDPVRIPTLLPAMRVREGACATDFSWQITTTDEVQALAEDFSEHCERTEAAARSPLPRELFEEALAEIYSVPGLVAERRYAEAIDKLDWLIGLGAEHETAFPEAARAIEEQVRGGLERIAEQIGALYDGGDAQREEAVALASEFLGQVRGLDLAPRIERYCR